MHRVIHNKIRKILFLKKKGSWKVVSQLQRHLHLPSKMVSFCSHSPPGHTHCLGSSFSLKSSFPSLSLFLVSKFASRKSQAIFRCTNPRLSAWRLASDPSLVTSFFCLILVSDSASSGTAVATCPETSRCQWNVSLASHVYPHQVFSLQSWC